MERAWISLIMASTMMMSMWSVVKADMSMYEAIPDQACGATCSFTRTVRSHVDCMTTCDQGSSLCYNPEAASCTCCSDTGGGSTCPAAEVTTECFQRHAICPADWMIIGDSCLFGHAEGLNFDSCKSVCESSGARILTVHSQTEADVITPFVGSGLERVWLGVFTNTSGYSRPWFYSDTGNLVTSANWADTEPSGPFTGNCVGTKLDLDLQWIDVPCDWIITCICQM